MARRHTLKAGDMARIFQSIWQVTGRMIRSPYRRLFYPHGPEWFRRRVPSVELIIGLRKCSVEEALKEQDYIDQSRLKVWLQGF